MAQIDAFFEALPRRLPANDLAAFEPMVAEDVEVWRNGEMEYDNRADWFAYLTSNPLANWSMGTVPAGVGIGRDDFYRTANGDIVVRELSSGIAPEGKQVLYHLGYNLHFVTYTLRDGVLTKVDYGRGMDRMVAPQSLRD